MLLFSGCPVCPTLCDPVDCSMPGLSVLHHLPELDQTHVHWISDAIQPSHSPFLPCSGFQCWYSIVVMSDFLQPHRLQCPGFPVLHQLLEFVQVHVHCVDDAFQPFQPRSPLLLPSVFPSIRVFSNESAPPIRWPKYWSFSTSPFKEYSRLISFRIVWFDHFAVQGTLKSLLKHYS